MRRGTTGSGYCAPGPWSDARAPRQSAQSPVTPGRRRCRCPTGEATGCACRVAQAGAVTVLHETVDNHSTSAPHGRATACEFGNHYMRWIVKAGVEGCYSAEFTTLVRRNHGPVTIRRRPLSFGADAGTACGCGWACRVRPVPRRPPRLCLKKHIPPLTAAAAPAPQRSPPPPPRQLADLPEAPSMEKALVAIVFGLNSGCSSTVSPSIFR